MELKEFIITTMTEIHKGIIESRESCPGMLIAPNRRQGGVYQGKDASIHQDIDVIEYEVILTDKDLSNKSKGIGVSFGSFGADYENKKGGRKYIQHQIKVQYSYCFS